MYKRQGKRLNLRERGRYAETRVTRAGIVGLSRFHFKPKKVDNIPKTCNQVSSQNMGNDMLVTSYIPPKYLGDCVKYREN